jgi:hypothetical protein
MTCSEELNKSPQYFKGHSVEPQDIMVPYEQRGTYPNFPYILGVLRFH